MQIFFGRAADIFVSLPNTDNAMCCRGVAVSEQHGSPRVEGDPLQVGLHAGDGQPALLLLQVGYSTLQYSTAQYSTVQHSTVQYSTAQYGTVHCCYYSLYVITATASISGTATAAHFLIGSQDTGFGEFKVRSVMQCLV